MSTGSEVEIDPAKEAAMGGGRAEAKSFEAQGHCRLDLTQGDGNGITRHIVEPAIARGHRDEDDQLVRAC